MDPMLFAIILVVAVVVLVAWERRRSSRAAGASAVAPTPTSTTTDPVPSALRASVVPRAEFVARWARDDGPATGTYATAVAHDDYRGLLGEVVRLSQANGSEVPRDREHHLVCAGCARLHGAAFLLGLTGGASGGAATCPECGAVSSIVVRGAQAEETGTSTLRVVEDPVAPPRGPVGEVDLALDALAVHGRWTPDDADREVCAEVLDALDRVRPGWPERLRAHNAASRPDLPQARDTFGLLLALHDHLVPAVVQRFQRIGDRRPSTATILDAVKGRVVEITFHPSKLDDPVGMTLYTREVGPDLETLLRAMRDVRP